MARVRAHLTYANLVSTLCLFIVLGGTSYAVARGSIGSREIKDNTVQSRDVRNGTLTVRDLKRSTRAGLRGPRGASGRRGPQGVPGERGPAGAAGSVRSVLVHTSPVNVPGSSGGIGVGSAACRPGERAVGGGFNSGGAGSVTALSAPSADGGANPAPEGATPNAWRVHIESAGRATTGNVWVVCVS